VPKHKSLEDKAESTKSNYIQYFGAREDEILRRVLAGATNKAIAEEMGLTENRVSFIVNSPIFQAKQTSKQEIINSKFDEKLSDDPVKRIFHESAEAAAKNIVRLSKNAKSEKVQAKTSNDVLGYDGYTQKPQEEHSTNIYIDKSTSKHLHVAIKALDIDEDMLEDLDVEGVVEEIGTTSKDKPKSISSTGKKKLLGVLQGDNAE
jgi:hypothetical protein